MTTFPMIPGVSAGGHVTRGGAWHPGSGYGCVKCPAPSVPEARVAGRRAAEAHRALMRQPKMQQLKTVVDMMPEDIARTFLRIYGTGHFRIGEAFFNALPLSDQDRLRNTRFNPFEVDHVVAVVNALEYLTS